MRIAPIALMALVTAAGAACTSTAPEFLPMLEPEPVAQTTSHFWSWEQVTRARTESLIADSGRLAAAGDHGPALACVDAAIAEVLSSPEGYEGGEAYLDYLAELIDQARSLERSMVEAVASEPPPRPAGRTSRAPILEVEALIPASDLPLVLNSRVGRFLEAATGRGDFHRRLERGLQRAGAYLPMIRAKLAAAGLPEDLAYLPIIESSFSLTAHSRAGAHGMWQFMPSTARQYGLRVTSWVDDRRDPIRSTDAAVRHLAHLHDEFGDWLLALAAYNSGSGRVRRAMQRTRSTDFWRLRRHLPRETRDYVPSFIAAVIVAKRPERYGFEPIFEQHWVPRPASPPSPRIAERTANPDGSYTVRRHDTLWHIARSFDVELDELCAHNGLSPDAVIRPGQSIALPARGSSAKAAVSYRVRPGDTLYAIARRFGVTVAALQSANGIHSAEIYPGDLLRIPSSRAKG